MTEQYYRLVESWAVDDWPLGMEPEIMADVNRVAPNCYSYHLHERDSETVVELYEYVGDREAITNGATTTES